MMPLPLEGLIVIGLEQAVAAPFCTARLADAGAQVIKIERPGGDFAREYDHAANGQSSYFVWLNRGKQSVVLDLTAEADREELRRLIASADIFVQNLRPGVPERMGLSIETLRLDHPELICCSISGYGEHGPFSHRKAYDLLVQAESGLASISGSGTEPGRVGISIVDIATGATAYAAILEAVIHRRRTGDGADIRLAMFDVIAEWMTVPLLQAEAGMPPRNMGLAHPSIAPYGSFRCRDGQLLLLAVQNDREWRALCLQVLRCVRLAGDARLATNVGRVAHRAELDGAIAEAIGAMGRDELIRRLSAADIAFGEVNDLKGLARHPHLRRTAVETPAGSVALPVAPASFDGEPRPLGAVPALGQNQPLAPPAATHG